ncbi:hypothetical protein KSF_109840 [Reticulibacter mediterranei]|uniref:Uncharacterized protein n=1 Tax=Reticulibacter mediterranei TaxID=2778369 RepID=A0A8J3J3L3_9CHLR|nr:hypothetical protein [Reticulibacter mediterranei]GHP00937.1 hypothetical protein KSF_109840 [Reticulibacter mediterranei]
MPTRHRRKKSGKKIRIDPNEPTIQVIIRFLAIFLASLIDHWFDKK